VEKIGNIFVPKNGQTRSRELKETKSKMSRVRKYLMERVKGFFSREESFRKEIEKERSARLKSAHQSKHLVKKKDFIKSNKDALKSLRVKSRKPRKLLSRHKSQKKDAQIAKLFQTVSFSYSQYSAFVEALTETAVYAKESARQLEKVCLS
jgi:alanyl-tRNA synthetase